MPMSNGVYLLLRGLGSLLRNIAAFLVRLANKSDQAGSAIRSSRPVPSSGSVSIDQTESSGQGTGPPAVGESGRLVSREGPGDQGPTPAPDDSLPPHWVEDIRQRRREIRSDLDEFHEQIKTPDGDMKRRSFGGAKAGRIWTQPLTRWTRWMRRRSSNVGRAQPSEPPSHWVEHIRQRRQAVRDASNVLEEQRSRPLHGPGHRWSSWVGVDQTRTQRPARWFDWLRRSPSRPEGVLPDDAPPHWVQYIRQRRRELGQNSEAAVGPDRSLYQVEEVRFPTAGRDRLIEVGHRSPVWWRRIPPLNWIGRWKGLRSAALWESQQDGAHSLRDSTAGHPDELDHSPRESQIAETLPTSFSQARHKTGHAAPTGKSDTGGGDRKAFRVRPTATEGKPEPSRPANGKFRVTSGFSLGGNAGLPDAWGESSSDIPQKQPPSNPDLSYWPDFPDLTEHQLQYDSAPVRPSSLYPLSHSASSNRGGSRVNQGDSEPDAFTVVHAWPSFLDQETDPPGTGQWEVKYRELRRMRRLEREQRGLLWNESLF
jgi:hypothetical protein